MKQDNLTEQAIAVIKKSIVSGEMKLGEAISELGICKKYNLSKTPVREALVILSHDELINKVVSMSILDFKHGPTTDNIVSPAPTLSIIL